MAHSRSALKRWRQSIERRDRNRSVKSRTRTLLTKALVAIDGDDAAVSEEAVRAAISGLDKAAQKGVIHANAAARSKSRLLKRYNLAVASAVATAAGSAPAAEEKPAPKGRAAASKPAAAKKPATKAKAADKDAKPTTRSRTRKT